MPLSDDELRELFAELAEPLPSERLTEKRRTMIRKLTAEANLRRDTAGTSDQTRAQNIKPDAAQNPAPRTSRRNAKRDDTR